MYQVGYFSDSLFGLMAISIPAVLWLIAFYLFSDIEKINTVVWVFIVSYLLLRVAGMLVFSEAMNSEVPAYLLLCTLPQLIMLGLSIHALYLSMRDYGSDLIEDRRKMRV